MKNPKSRAPKRDPKASRTTTTQIAMKDNNRGLDNNLTIVTSKLAPHEIPPLNLKLKDVDIFEIPDSIIEEDLGRAYNKVTPTVGKDASHDAKNDSAAHTVQPESIKAASSSFRK